MNKSNGVLSQVINGFKMLLFSALFLPLLAIDLAAVYMLSAYPGLAQGLARWCGVRVGK